MLTAKLRDYLDLIRWDRPVGWLLLLWPTLSALWIASGGWPGWHLLMVFTFGTILMRSAGCCVNDVADADFDRHVKRTANRPVTSGRVGRKEALAVGAVLAMMAFALVLTTNRLTVIYSFVAIAIAVLYPFSKRFVSMPQAVLGIAFSFGIPMAFTAVQGSDFPTSVAYNPPLIAWLLLLSNFFWVLAYDTEYAMVDRDDDVRIGMKTSAITLARCDVAAVLVFYGLYLVSWLYLAVFMQPFWNFAHMGTAQVATFLIVFVLTLGQVVWHWLLIRSRSREGCFKAFRLNHWLGFTLFAGLVVMHALK